jgi:hypothetical protein
MWVDFLFANLAISMRGVQAINVVLNATLAISDIKVVQEGLEINMRTLMEMILKTSFRLRINTMI